LSLGVILCGGFANSNANYLKRPSQNDFKNPCFIRVQSVAKKQTGVPVLQQKRRFY